MEETVLYCPISESGNTFAFYEDRKIPEWIVANTKALTAIGELRAKHPLLKGVTREAYLCGMLKADILMGGKGKPSKRTRKFIRALFPEGFPEISYRISATKSNLLIITVKQESRDILIYSASYDNQFNKRLQRWKRKHFTTTS